MQTLWLIIGMALGGFVVWVFMRAHVRNALGARREAAEMFEALSARALRDSSESFLQLAQAQVGAGAISPQGGVGTALRSAGFLCSGGGELQRLLVILECHL